MDNIRQAKKERRKAERKWRSSKLEFDLAVFKRKRNAVNNLLNKERREFYTNFIEENSVNQRRLFRASKRLLNVSRDDGLSPNLHAPTFVNDLGQYFVTRLRPSSASLTLSRLILSLLYSTLSHMTLRLCLCYCSLILKTCPPVMLLHFFIGIEVLPSGPHALTVGQ